MFGGDYLDSNVIEQWFYTYSDEIYKFLAYFTGKTDVDDIVQETFFRAMKNLHGYHGNSSPKTWLFTIARNVARDYYRKHHIITVPDVFLKSVTSHEMTPEESSEFNETKEYIFSLLQSLNPQYRAVLILRGIYDMSSEDVANVLHWTPRRVNTAFHRALKAVRQADLVNKVREGKQYGFSE